MNDGERKLIGRIREAMEEELRDGTKLADAINHILSVMLDHVMEAETPQPIAPEATSAPAPADAPTDTELLDRMARDHWVVAEYVSGWKVSDHESNLLTVGWPTPREALRAAVAKVDL